MMHQAQARWNDYKVGWDQSHIYYSHLSNNRGGWNKRAGVQKLQNQLDFFHQFLC